MGKKIEVDLDDIDAALLEALAMRKKSSIEEVTRRVLEGAIEALVDSFDAFVGESEEEKPH